MSDSPNIFCGCIPALMTPCNDRGVPQWDALVATGNDLIQKGMRAVVYCGSMGDWPLLSDKQRKEVVRRLVEAGVPVVVGTWAPSPRQAAAHAAHAKQVGAAGLMMIPRLMSRGTSPAAQRADISGVLCAGDALPKPVLRLIELCARATQGDVAARRPAAELDDALRVPSTFD